MIQFILWFEHDPLMFMHWKLEPLVYMVVIFKDGDLGMLLRLGILCVFLWGCKEMSVHPNREDHSNQAKIPCVSYLVSVLGFLLL